LRNLVNTTQLTFNVINISTPIPEVLQDAIVDRLSCYSFGDNESKTSLSKTTDNTAQKTKIDQGHLQILLVEDNVVALHLIEVMAAQAGLKYISAVDGEQAFKLVTLHHFDLIITDVGLPGISGYELTRAIRTWEKKLHKKPMPIIGLTAHTLHEAEYKCLQAGMNSVICKPINLSTIQQIVQQYVSITP